MKTNSEIKVRLFTGSIDRLRISSGAIKVLEINGIPCHEETFVPKEPWERLNEFDCQRLITLKKHNYNDISLIKLPRNLIKLFENLKLKNCINNNDIHYIQDSSKGIYNMFENINEDHFRQNSGNYQNNSLRKFLMQPRI